MNIALITSTIAPDPNVHQLVRTNVADRLEDYKVAFSFYCDQLCAGVFDRLVYVDNSGFDLKDIQTIARAKGIVERVEFIGYKSTISPNNNRFFLEINLIDFFVKSSKTLRDHPNAMVWKITGRYLIKNVGNIVACCNTKPADLYVNMRNRPYKVVDFYLVGFNLAAYEALFLNNLAKYEGLHDDERALRRHLDTNTSPNLRIEKRLPVTPRLIGVRGFDGGRYGGWNGTVKFYIRLISNKVLPFLWI